MKEHPVLDAQSKNFLSLNYLYMWPFGASLFSRGWGDDFKHSKFSIKFWKLIFLAVFLSVSISLPRWPWEHLSVSQTGAETRYKTVILWLWKCLQCFLTVLLQRCLFSHYTKRKVHNRMLSIKHTIKISTRWKRTLRIMKSTGTQ